MENFRTVFQFQPSKQLQLFFCDIDQTQLLSLRSRVVSNACGPLTILATDVVKIVITDESTTLNLLILLLCPVNLGDRFRDKAAVQVKKTMMASAP
jgi:hypothetical protein